jgi:hypothetical protein
MKMRKRNSLKDMLNWRIFLLTWFILSSLGIWAAPLSAQQNSELSKNPQVFNISLPSASTEVPFAVPKGTTRLRMTARGGPIFSSWTSGASGTTYVTTLENGCYCQKDVLLSSGAGQNTLYLQTPSSGGVTAEIEIWH